MLALFQGLMSWANGIVLAVVLSFGLVSGIWIGHKFFVTKVPWKTQEVYFKLKSGEKVRAKLLILDGKKYYPSDALNTWLREKVHTPARVQP